MLSSGQSKRPLPTRNTLPVQCALSRVPGTSSGPPFPGLQPTHAGNDGWCAGDPCSQHGHNAVRPAECDEAARQNSCLISRDWGTEDGQENNAFMIHLRM